MAEVSLKDWNLFISRYPDAHLLQTGAWGSLKSSFGWEPVRIVLDDGIGVQILFRSLPFGFTLAYLPKPVFREQINDLDDNFWDAVDQACKKRRAVLLKIELDRWGKSDLDLRNRLKLKESPHNIQPPRTILIDLRGSENEILARMKQKTRYNIRLASKKGVNVRPWDDISGFHQMMLVTGGRDGFGVHSVEYFKCAYDLFQSSATAELLVAEYEGVPLAALMVFAHGKRAWYLYGASNDAERNRMPTYLLQWEAIRWARAKGAEEYDLWGVPDEEADTLESQFTERSDGLWGVYRFKRGFGGVLKRGPQAIDRIYNPLLYKLYLWRFASGASI